MSQWLGSVPAGVSGASEGVARLRLCVEDRYDRSFCTRRFRLACVCDSCVRP